MVLEVLWYLNQASYLRCTKNKEEEKKVGENFNQHSVNNTFSDAMVVAITSNAAIKTNSNAAFIHCCNHTAFCRVKGGKQSRAEETRRGPSSGFFSPCCCCVFEDATELLSLEALQITCLHTSRLVLYYIH